jgi:glycogen operon protein
MVGPMATRLSGSSDLYEETGRAPYCSINFITSHDGFTMNDLVSYKDKHNEANNEGNRDGDNHNSSDNYGVEGPTRKKTIDQLRLRQIKNMLTTLLFSQGVPMIVMGDEVRKTQKGNNNAYCQDNEISWFNWSLVNKNEKLLRFVQQCIQFRKDQPALRRTDFLTGRPSDKRGVADVSWFQANGYPVNWDAPDGTLVCWLTKPPAHEDPEGLGRDVLIMMNPTHETHEFSFPEVTRGMGWRKLLDTAAESPDDFFPPSEGPEPLPNRKLEMVYKSMVVWIGSE